MTRIQWVIGIGTGIALAVTAAMNAQPAPDTTIDTTADNGYPAPVPVAYPGPVEPSEVDCFDFEGQAFCDPHDGGYFSTPVVLPTPTSAPTMTPEP